MLTVHSWRQARLGARLQQALLEYSPHNPPLVATSVARAGQDA
jgi:hypothetical protein